MDSAKQTSHAHPLRPWLRFNIRTLLVLLTAFGIWLGVQVNRATEQRRAVHVVGVLGGHVVFQHQHQGQQQPGGPAWLRRLMGDEYFVRVVGVALNQPSQDADLAQFARVKALSELKRLSLRGPGFSDQGLRYLKHLKDLQHLTLVNTQVTDAGLLELWKVLPALQIYGHRQFDFLKPTASFATVMDLDLSGPHITDVGVARLQAMVALRVLNLADTQITDRGLMYLRNLRNLCLINLDRTSIADHGLEQLSGLPRLRWLQLRGTQVTNEGLKQVGKMASLGTVYLDDTQLTDEGLLYLLNLPQLHTLSLRNTRVTNDSISTLVAMARLESLDVGNTNITPVGRDQLRRRLPQLQIRY